MYDDENRVSDAACRELLDHVLLDHVLQDERAWMNEIAPGGVSSAKLTQLTGGMPPPDDRRPLSTHDLREGWLGFLGHVLWNVFSKDHVAVGPDGEHDDLGSFREARGSSPTVST